jgi:hypothetical protein
VGWGGRTPALARQSKSRPLAFFFFEQPRRDPRDAHHHRAEGRSLRGGIRRSIVEAAASVFAEHGYERAATSEVLRRGFLIHGMHSWGDRFNLTTRLLAEGREQGEVLPQVVPGETAECVVATFTGVQLVSEAINRRADLAVVPCAPANQFSQRSTVPGDNEAIPVSPRVATRPPGAAYRAAPRAAASGRDGCLRPGPATARAPRPPMSPSPVR